jgi:hypothetical protein
MPSTVQAGGRSDARVRLHAVLEHAAHLLPAQGPIGVFIHHNTLHAFEELAFDEAVAAGARLFGCQPYLPEEAYRQMHAQGRITDDDLSAALLDDLQDRADVLIGFMGTRFSLRRALLEHPLRSGNSSELRWFVAETDALNRFCAETSPAGRRRAIVETRHWVLRDLRGTGARAKRHERESTERARVVLADLLSQASPQALERWSDRDWEGFTLQALWRACRQGVHAARSEDRLPVVAPVRLRDRVLAAAGVDSDLSVHEVLIRFAAAFLDQGFSHWQLPHREEGFLQSFCRVYAQPGSLPDHALRGLAEAAARCLGERRDPLQSILESLDALGVREPDWPEFVTASLLALKGWAGMIQHVESRPDRVARPVPRGSLAGILAARLMLDRLALGNIARDRLGYTGSLADLARLLPAPEPPNPVEAAEIHAFLLFQLAQLMGWLPAELFGLSQREWSLLINEIDEFSSLDRRRVFHAAFERRYRIWTLDALSVRARRPCLPPQSPRFQVVCCIDEREESFRRPLEEVAPDVETFGTAGFFATAMYYRGVADAHFVPLCPIVVRPQHWVVERPAEPHAGAHDERRRVHKVLGSARHRFHVGTRSATAGALLTSLFGVLSSAPLVARVLFPRATASLQQILGRYVHPAAVPTTLELERRHATSGPGEGQIGYTVDEMAGIVARVLEDIGLVRGFSNLILIVGHGSSSLNNPHESAHDCGACGGGRGGPNARAFSRMANDPRVRERLLSRGIELPPQTHFVGVYHNTCDDAVVYFDLESLPASHREEFERARRDLHEARSRNAHERCRRFESAALEIGFSQSLAHVEARSEDLAQVRPEYGHATNAVCVVGRRSRTRGLFLDRRTFLVSYDPAGDDEKRSILTRILQAVVPVCAGINLEYYFSVVDPPGWGCGTKLPHNVTSLLGVMDGAGSDLRPGLPWQMVEIHEPVRLLFVIETGTQALRQILAENEDIARLCRNGWVQLAALDPDSPSLHHYRNGWFERYRPTSMELPVVQSSAEWYSGWRDHLGYALVES